MHPLGSGLTTQPAGHACVYEVVTRTGRALTKNRKKQISSHAIEQLERQSPRFAKAISSLVDSKLAEHDVLQLTGDL